MLKTLSDLGQKVLLIDGDMRKPTHKRLKKIILKDYLIIFQTLISFESIQTCESFANLGFNYFRANPPDSTRLISSGKNEEINNKQR